MLESGIGEDYVEAGFLQLIQGGGAKTDGMGELWIMKFQYFVGKIDIVIFDIDSNYLAGSPGGHIDTEAAVTAPDFQHFQTGEINGVKTLPENGVSLLLSIFKIAQRSRGQLLCSGLFPMILISVVHHTCILRQFRRIVNYY